MIVVVVEGKEMLHRKASKADNSAQETLPEKNLQDWVSSGYYCNKYTWGCARSNKLHQKKDLEQKGPADKETMMVADSYYI